MSVAGPGAEEKEARVKAHLWLAELIARELAWLGPRTIDGDVLAAAYEGLVKAADRFDPGRGDFVAYARKWIRGEIFRAVDRQLPGFSRRYGPAASLLDEAPEELSEEGAAEALDHAALAMCLGSESLRRARAETGELPGAIGEVLSGMPEAKREALVGRFVEGLTWEELAAQLAVSESTVKRWSREGLGALRERLRAPASRVA